MTSQKHPFDENYFTSGAYADVSFDKFSQYWWSNRFYALLARRYGPKSGRVLEVGCGLGHLLGWLVDRYHVFGTDINLWALEQARRNVPKAYFILSSAENLGAFPKDSFDIVIAKHLVEHLPNPEKAIAEMARTLAPKGMLLLATPNLASPMRKRKGKSWIGYKDPTHINLLSPEEWLGMMRSKGLRVRHTFSDGFWDPPYIPFLPEKLQKLIFGAPGGLQAILGWGIIPLRMGESLIAMAEKS